MCIFTYFKDILKFRCFDLKPDGPFSAVRMALYAVLLFIVYFGLVMFNNNVKFRGFFFASNGGFPKLNVRTFLEVMCKNTENWAWPAYQF